MAKYVLSVSLPKGKNIKSLNGAVEAVRRLAPQGSYVTLVKQELDQSRAARRDSLMSDLEDVVSGLEELQSEMEDWYENLPEGLQGSEKGEMVQQAASDLEEAAQTAQGARDDLENLDPEAEKAKLVAAIVEAGAAAVLAYSTITSDTDRTAAINSLRAALADLEKAPEEAASEMQGIIDTASEAKDQAENVEFPGMY